jgi:peroxiredoxin Q/BCP
MIEEGKRAPSFRLDAADGGKVALSDFVGRYVVVYFYPKDDTPGCTTEAKDFRDAAKKLKTLDAAVIGISKDSIESHCKFRDKHALNFALLSNPDGKVIEKYDAWGERNMYGRKFMGILRSTVVIAPDGTVVRHFPKVKVAGHVEEVLETIRDHQTG